MTIFSAGATIAMAGRRAGASGAGALPHETSGFEGAERDLRASGGLPAASLSPQAARMILPASLGAGAGHAAPAAAPDG